MQIRSLDLLYNWILLVIEHYRIKNWDGFLLVIHALHLIACFQLGKRLRSSAAGSVCNVLHKLHELHFVRDTCAANHGVQRSATDGTMALQQYGSYSNRREHPADEMMNKEQRVDERDCCASPQQVGVLSGVQHH